MASFQVFRDQENHLTENQDLKNATHFMQHKKRSPLRTLDGNNITEKRVLGLQISTHAHLKFGQKSVYADTSTTTSVRESCYQKFEGAQNDKENPKNSIRFHSEEQNGYKDEKYFSVTSDKPLLCDIPLPNLLKSPKAEIDTHMSIDKSETKSILHSGVIGDRRNKTFRNALLDIDEYEEDIFNYIVKSEIRQRPKFGYMKKQPDITYSMRSILVDWLVEVAEEYKLQNETIYLAVSYLDRFLSYMSVVKSKLQLVGTTAMFLAAKYEEIYPPDVGEFAYITDDTYTKVQILKMEQLMVKVLDFDLSVPSILSFINMFCVKGNLSETVLFLAMYISELSLLEADPFLQYLPSQIAASSVYISRQILEDEISWEKDMVKITNYNLQETLQPCIEHLQRLHESAEVHPQQAIREKYKTDRWNNVSLITQSRTSL